MAYQEKVNYSGPMPNEFSGGDEEYIKQQLLRLPSNRLRAIVAARYAQAYREAYDAETVDFRKENKGRHEANKRIRIFIDRQLPYMNGKIDDGEEYIP